VRITEIEHPKRPYDVSECDWVAWIRVENGDRSFWVRLQIGYQATFGEAQAFVTRLALGETAVILTEAGERGIL